MADLMELECKSLLLKLKLKQHDLKHLIPPGSSANSSCNTSITSDTYSDNVDSKSPNLKASYARNKLKSFIRSPSDSLTPSVDENVSLNSTKFQYKPPVHIYHTTTLKPSHKQNTDLSEKFLSEDKPFEREISANFFRDINNYFDDSQDITLESIKTDDRLSQVSITPPRLKSGNYSSIPITPNTVQRRYIIDKNIPVSSSHVKDLDLTVPSSKLNFNYTDVDDQARPLSSLQSQDLTDNEQTFLKSRLNASPEDIFLKEDKDSRAERRLKERLEEMEKEKEKARKEKEEKLYKKYLEDGGNSKHQVSMFKEAIQPRSILSSPNSTRNKPPSKVSFQSSMLSTTNDTFQQENMEPPTSRMLGYDWIAALLDNETGCMDESESYFNELKEFRRANKDECSNNFYMNSPLTFAEPKEASPVQKALTEPKVQPYTVNDRLFTKPLKKNLMDDLSDSEHEESVPNPKNPRYVRVSIPRSTLEKPYKLKPHRRNSFDPTDSCSLREHCLMGWENSRVSSLPTASSVDINEATEGPKPKMVTTLAEAEQIARSGTTQMWPFIPPPRPADPLPTWRKQYESSVINLSNPSMTTDSVIPGDSDSLRKSTNSLLNSTYSIMYEMERLKKERESTKA